MKTTLAALATAGILLQASVALATPMGRVAVLGPERSAIVPRLQRNFADKEHPSQLVSAVVSSCTRVTVAKQLYDLDADTAICTDGDVVSVWKLESDYVQLIDAVPIVHGDDRSIEILAARITIAARSGKTSNESQSTTIFATNDDQHTDTAAIIRDATRDTRPTPSVDKPVPIAALPAEKIAPRVVAGIGPMLLGSKSGGSFAMSLEAEFGVSRVVTFIPWIATIPVPRFVETQNGSANYRPTIFGAGFGIPLRSWKKTFVPRLGAGYALIWMHTWPEQAKNGTTVGESEDLWAPAMYATAALSVGITNNIRVAAEGMFGTATHNLILRIAHEHTDSWGVPIASIGARAEVVLP